MTQQKQAAENQADKNNRPKTKPAVTPELGHNSAGPGQLSLDLLGAADDGALGGQAARLSDPRFQIVQRQAMVTQIGRRQGNQHLQRLLATPPAQVSPGPFPVGQLIQRQVPTPAPASGQSPPPVPAPADPNAALPQFPFKQKTVSFSGGHGDFDATYTPVAPVPTQGTLDIVLRVQVDFKDFDPDMALKEPFKSYFKEHPMTKAQKGDFKWTEDEKKEKGSKFKADFQSSVAQDWSGKHALHLKKADFAEYRAEVKVKVEVMEDGSKGQPHVHLYVQKVPKGVEARFRSFVGSEPDPNDSETDPAKKSQRKMAVLDYRDPSQPEKRTIQPQRLVGQIKSFGFDSAELTSDLASQVDTFNRDVQPFKADLKGGDWFVSVVGRASARGSKAYNEKLGERRATAVYQRLDEDIRKEAAIGSQGKENASEDEKFQRVDVAVVNMKKRDEVTQNVASHEAGHMFGLGDEYEDEKPDVNAIPKFAGDKPTHYDRVEELMGEEAAKELTVQKSGSMMSSGGEVKRGHYVNFLEAMNSITGESWAVE